MAKKDKTTNAGMVEIAREDSNENLLLHKNRFRIIIHLITLPDADPAASHIAPLTKKAIDATYFSQLARYSPYRAIYNVFGKHRWFFV